MAICKSFTQHGLIEHLWMAVCKSPDMCVCSYTVHHIGIMYDKETKKGAGK